MSHDCRFALSGGKKKKVSIYIYKKKLPVRNRMLQTSHADLGDAQNSRNQRRTSGEILERLYLFIY